MKTYITIALLFVTFYSFSQAVISPELISIVENTEKSEDYIEVNVFFNNNQSLDELSLYLDETNADFDTRVKEVTELMKQNSDYSLSEFFNGIELKGIESRVKDVRSFWGVNMINLKIQSSFIYQLASFSFVRYIDTNSPRYRIYESEKPVVLVEKEPGDAEPGLKTINAHLLWELGYTGRNILFLSMDTGVYPDHPAIDDNFAGNHFPMSQCWYGVRSELPADHASSSHGTHTTGTVLGLDRATNDTIGVAYNAMWIASDHVASSDSDLLDPTDFMAVFEWVLDPDGNPETTDDVPRVINNSWGYDYSLAMQFGACEMVESEILITLETAGICSPFSAGNDGPGASTTGFPAMRAFNLVNPMAIGALQTGGELIASFSSRGPTPCIEESGSLQIKPEVSAPGVNVRSCVGTDEYGALSGTSMACPHVAGALLLLAEAFPEASAYELKNSLYVTAIDIGDAGEDNVYGNGLIDVFAAYEYLALTYTPEPPIGNQYDLKSEIVSPVNTIICPDNSNFTSEIEIVNDGTETIDQIELYIYLNEVLVLDSIIDISIAPSQVYTFTTEEYEFDFGKNTIHSVIKSVYDYTEYDRFNNADIATYYVIQEDVFPFAMDFTAYNDDLSDSNWLLENPDNTVSWENLTWGDEEEYKALAFNYSSYPSRNWETDFANLPIISLPDTEPLYLSFTYAYQKRVEYLYKDSLVVELSTDCCETFPHELWRNGG
ncbi:MAG: hypothetical protein C0596_05190 [Marinilabiliales bacterium]|nr:MAG: hypothetical protein C0596_05190 [Marinilabiliales bacterium]